METPKISFTKKSLIEPAIFLATAMLAGTPRLIQHLPGATKGGLLVAGSLGAATCALHDYTSDGKAFSATRKVTFLGLGLISAFAITQSLKGRVTLSLADISKLFLIGGALTLLKNWIEFSPSKVTHTPKKSVPVPEGEKTLFYTSRFGAPLVRIPAGRGIPCISKACYPDVQKVTIDLVDDVFEINTPKGKTFLMNTTDFNTLHSICHRGAFGADHEEVTDLSRLGFRGGKNQSYTLLWKIPGDLDELLEIPEGTFAQYPVGTYPIYGNIALEENDAALTALMKVVITTKYRTIYPGPSTIHHLVDQEKCEIPGLPMKFFYKNFDSPTQAERTNVQNTLLPPLKALGFGAFQADMQHFIVIGTYQGERITPQRFAELLANDPKITEALKAGAIDSQKDQIDIWKALYIQHFLTA
ncbi:MAG: hypothetical protein H7A38_03925 [Chlamydiales bacterium]|nr:hypothetical protein [Chlamydiales bacterium]